jgi:hypothetical protein
VLEALALEHDALGARVERGTVERLVGRAGQHEDAATRGDEAVDHRDRQLTVTEVQVEQHHVGLEQLRLGQHGALVERGRNRGLDAVDSQGQAERVGEDGVVLHDEHAGWAVLVGARARYHAFPTSVAGSCITACKVSISSLGW